MFRSVMCLVACAALVFAPAQALGQDNACYQWAADESSLADKLNRYRTDNDRKELHLDPEASRVARKWATRMMNRDTLRAPTAKFLNKHLTDWETVGAIQGLGSANGIFRAFKNSESHSKEMLRRMWRHVGIGVVNDGEDDWVSFIFIDTNPGTTLTMPDCP